MVTAPDGCQRVYWLEGNEAGAACIRGVPRALGNQPQLRWLYTCLTAPLHACVSVWLGFVRRYRIMKPNPGATGCGSRVGAGMHTVTRPSDMLSVPNQPDGLAFCVDWCSIVLPRLSPYGEAQGPSLINGGQFSDLTLRSALGRFGFSHYSFGSCTSLQLQRQQLGFLPASFLQLPGRDVTAIQEMNVASQNPPLSSIHPQALLSMVALTSLYAAGHPAPKHPAMPNIQAPLYP